MVQQDPNVRFGISLLKDPCVVALFRQMGLVVKKSLFRMYASARDSGDQEGTLRSILRALADAEIDMNDKENPYAQEWQKAKSRIPNIVQTFTNGIQAYGVAYGRAFALATNRAPSGQKSKIGFEGPDKFFAMFLSSVAEDPVVESGAFFNEVTTRNVLLTSKFLDTIAVAVTVDVFADPDQQAPGRAGMQDDQLTVAGSVADRVANTVVRGDASVAPPESVRSLGTALSSVSRGGAPSLVIQREKPVLRIPRDGAAGGAIEEVEEVNEPDVPGGPPPSEDGAGSHVSGGGTYVDSFSL